MIGLCEVCGQKSANVEILEGKPPFRHLCLCRDCYKAGMKVAYANWKRIDTMPVWMQIAERAAADRDTLKLLKNFVEAGDRAEDGDEKADKKFMELGSDVHSCLEQLSDEFLEHYPDANEDFAHAAEDRIREQMDDHFFEAADKNLELKGKLTKVKAKA